jgi:thiol:disulfide interchange protein
LDEKGVWCLLSLFYPIMPRFLLFTAAFFFSLLTSSQGQYEFGKELEGTGGVTVATLHSENKVIAPGKPFTVALRLAHPANWHSYYKNTGGVAFSPQITWTLPEGFTAGEIQWPVPEIKDVYGSLGFVYGGTPVFLVEITPPTDLKAGENVTLSAAAKWQICDPKSCNNEEAKLTLDLKSADAPEVDPAKSAFFKKARATQPKVSSAWTLAVESARDSVKIRMTPGKGAAENLETAGLQFIPADNFVLTSADGGSVAKDGRDWLITLKRAKEAPNGDKIIPGKTLSGILTAKSPLDTTLGANAILLSGAAVTTPPPLPPAPLSLMKLLPILGGMLLGGLILNLMPCVFPVIGLKIMGFVQQSGEDSKKIMLHGLMFTLGVLASFWVLSGVLFAARAAALAKSGSADSIGWGYQLQNPWVVLGLLLMMFVLALNMYGVFEIGASATSVGGKLQSKSGLSGTFFSGVLATLVATPCSAPFLGVAIGTAIGLPAVQFFLAFTAMGIGLSTPYLVLSIFPKLIHLLPRPGAWMESFKQAMAFFLFATAGYLLWVYTGQIGLENMLGPIFGLSAIAIATWILGRWNLPYREKSVRYTAMTLALLFAVGGFWMIKPPTKSLLVWEHWSAERVTELVEAGTPVYVDFTAQWCATCQFNKKRAYTPEVIQLMKEKGIVALKGDKTNPDPTIEEKLRELGRTAIPVNVLYVPGKEPIITPELLTADYLKELFSKEIPAKE